MVQRIPTPSDRRPGHPTGLLAMAVVVLVALGVWWLNGGDPGSPSGRGSEIEVATAAPTPSPRLTVEMVDLVDLDDLPPEAAETVVLIDAGGPYPYEEDGSRFGNYEGLLPERDSDYYREYTVETPGSDDRGARRIVAGADGELYWTADHYDSFALVDR